MSGSIIYTYVGGNPVSRIDPLGLLGAAPELGLQPVCFECLFIPAARLPMLISRLVEPATPGINDLINKYPRIKQSKETTQCQGQGGFRQANEDFDAYTGGLTQKNYPGDIRSAELLDGATISVRPSSSGGDPTIQINPTSGPTIKIRY